MLIYPKSALHLCALFFAVLGICGGSHASRMDPVVPTVSVKAGRAVTESYSNLNMGSRARYVVDWQFYGNSGRIVAVQLRAGDYASCELYQVEGNALKLIQAHPFCSWTIKPRLVTGGGVIGIEFPIKIRQGADYPVNESSVQIDFDATSKGICTYNNSYEDNSASVPKCPVRGK